MSPDDRLRPPRVRVTGPPRRGSRLARTGDIDAGTRLGGMYMRSLLRVQLRLAGIVLTVLVGTLGVIPLLLHLAPGLADLELLGLPLSWLVLGVLVYPYLVLLGWLYIRRAERNERQFAELMSEVDR